MDYLKARPAIMNQAETDLASHLPGRFSPTDWELILDRAEKRWREELPKVNGHELAAWQAVVRDFFENSSWGFVPNYQPPKPQKKPGNLGVAFIWMAFQTFVLTKIAVVWLGQIYTRTQDPWDGLLFYSAIALVLANFGFFLWRHRRHKD